MRALAAAALVVLTTAVLAALDADRMESSLVYVLAVLGAAFLGLAPAAVAVVVSFAAENYFFTPPVGSFRITKSDDLLALLVFVVTGAIVSVAVARTNELRRRTDVREREARARLELTGELLSGRDVDQVVAAAEAAMCELFDLERCRIDPAGRADLEPVGTLPASDRAVIDAFAAGIATSLDRVRLDQEAERARLDAAVEHDRAAFLSTMTHNLRTPLACIKSALSTLRMADLPLADRGALITTAEGETERLERLVAKVLELSRIRSGAVVARPELVDVSDLAAAALRRVAHLAEGRDVRLASAPDLALVRADPVLVDVALSCLLENALRYAPASDVIVETHPDPGRGFELRVVDHGPGVPEPERSLIFEEFVRGERGHATPGTGAGLGLVIARAFASAHGGGLDVAETPGGGATFIMRFSRPEAVPT